MQIMETAEKVDVRASRNNTVDQVIRHVLYMCRNSEELKGKVSLPFASAKGRELWKLKCRLRVESNSLRRANLRNRGPVRKQTTRRDQHRHGGAVSEEGLLRVGYPELHLTQR